jgi:hypothetical protein
MFDFEYSVHTQPKPGKEWDPIEGWNPLFRTIGLQLGLSECR